MRTVSRSTGTDADSFAYANDGCPSVLISIPLRYMHTTVEMLHKDDIEQTIQLMYETLLTLKPNTNLNYLLMVSWFYLYIDPGSGSYLVQMIIAAVLGGYSFKEYLVEDQIIFYPLKRKSYN
jgi:hypothetical protein